jgi:hypothetical protein
MKYNKPRTVDVSAVDIIRTEIMFPSGRLTYLKISGIHHHIDILGGYSSRFKIRK